MGGGYGIGASATVSGATVGVTAYHNMIDLGLVENETMTASVTGGEIGIGILSYSQTYEHRYESSGEFGTKKYRDGHDIFSSPIEVVGCENTSRSSSIGVAVVSLDGDNDISVSIGAKCYVGVGGSIKIEFNISEFKRLLREKGV